MSLHVGMFVRCTCVPSIGLGQERRLAMLHPENPLNKYYGYLMVSITCTNHILVGGGG